MKNQYKITRQLMMSWAKDFPIFTVSTAILYILYSFAALVGFFLLASLLATGGESSDYLIAILILIISLYRLFFSRIVRTVSTYNRLSNMFNSTEWVQTVEFCEDKIKVSLHNSTGEYSYSQIKKVVERRKQAFIIFKNGVLRLYKDAFVEGSWEECKEKLTAHIKKS